MTVTRGGKWIRVTVLAAAGALGLFTGRAAWSSGDAIVLTDSEKKQYYETQVKPILEQACLKCHGADGKVKGGLNLMTRAGLVHGGEVGPAVDLENPSKSLLLKAVGYEDEDLQMPPKEKLSDQKIAVLARWVEMGAPYAGGAADAVTPAAPKAAHGAPQVTEEAKKFWSFQPVKRPAVPEVKHKAWVKNPVDAFVLAKLEAAGLKPAAPADKVALLRRAYFDLIGLAPTPEEAEAFLKDKSPDAFEKVVDRLLAMPQYGEKWGRHWLDVVRFAETNSFERDGLKPNAWRYRDYVIDAFNQDKPYDQFVREQVAGDELDQVTHESMIATGIYRLGQWDDEPSDRLQARYDELDDLVTTVGQGFLGLTINCARCHDHKIDPIPQKDYYSLLAFFQNVTPYSNGRSVMQEIVPPDQLKAIEQEREALEARRADLRKLIAHFEEPVIAKLTEQEKEAIKRPRRREVILEQKILAATNADDLRHYKNYKAELKDLVVKDDNTPKALVVKENGPTAPVTHLLKRGNASSPGEEVQPAFPQILSPSPAVIPQPKPGQKTSGRRRVLAEWIADAKNPLTARVMANRIWQHHFGRGIVRSGNDFGTAGDKPTHPELLDWLASEFTAGGWRMKAMHKLVMLSNAYQMASTAAPEALAKDPMNDHFWRFDMRRLTAEEIRDTILKVTGKLNLKMGGPGIYPTIPAAILAGQSVPGAGWGKSSPEEASRRSVYIHVKRSLVLPMVAAFDGPDTDFSCPSRFVTTQSTQALMMLNSDLINDEAKAFAARLKKEAGADATKQVTLGLRLALSREPAADEIDRGVKFMETLRTKHTATPDVALEQFALLVLNLNEFVYLD